MITRDLQNGVMNGGKQIADLTPISAINAELSETTIIVKQASDFGVIDSTKVYVIDGIIDMGATQIVVPVGGITIIGYSFDVSGLISSEDNYTMFVSESIAIGSGNVLGADYHISVTGAASKVYELYDATGFNAFEFIRVNYNDCTSLGDIYDYRQGLETGTGRFGGSPSLTLHGLWVGGYRITTSIVRSFAGTMTEPLFKAGNLFQMNSRFLTDINVDLSTLASLLDFAPVNFHNPSTLQLQGCIVTRDGAFDADDSNYTQNISESDLSCAWADNNGMKNTFVGGEATLTTEILTAINTQGVFESLNGTYTESSLTHFDSPAEGQLRHLGSNPREFTVIADFIIDGGQNDVIDLKLVKYDSSAASNVDIFTQRRQINALVGSRDVAFFNIVKNINLDQDDYIFWEVANETDTTNVTAEIGSYFIVNPR